jgi:plastocyanin
MRGQHILSYIAGLGAAAISACSAPATAASTLSVQQQKFAVSTTDDPYRFQPATLTVPAGTMVMWTNTARDQHTVTDDPSRATSSADAALPPGVQAWDSGALIRGETYIHTFTTPGTYKYFCTIHESLGMLGTITVT